MVNMSPNSVIQQKINGSIFEVCCVNPGRGYVNPGRIHLNFLRGHYIFGHEVLAKRNNARMHSNSPLSCEILLVSTQFNNIVKFKLS